eukprot:10335018-Lingulodinium_polyedra.AAC.1
MASHTGSALSTCALSPIASAPLCTSLLTMRRGADGSAYTRMRMAGSKCNGKITLMEDWP